LGDFAFIIYDALERSTFAARDHLGVKPLFYRASTTGIAIASEVRVLRSIGRGFPDLGLGEVVDTQLANFIAHRPNAGDDTVFFSGILRLKAGHTLTYTKGNKLKIHQYWRPEILENSLSSDERPLVLRELFMEAVKCRLRSHKPVAVLLSGGLDSSSIACCVDRLQAGNSSEPIDTYSIVFDDSPKFSEREFIESVVNSGNFRPHYLSLNGYAPFGNFEGLVAAQGRLFNAPAMTMAHLLLEKMHNDGVEVYLDGHGGDEVVSHGTKRIHQLAEQRKWRSLWRELRIPDGEPSSLRLVYFFGYFVQFGKFKGAYTLKKILRAFNRSKLPSPNNLLGPKLLKLEHESQPRDAKSESESHLEAIRSTLREEALELLEVAAAVQGTQARFPFFDKRVVEFCLTVPLKEKHDNGWPRLILRKAMEGILPSKIQWRTTKFDFGHHLSIGILKHHRGLVENIIAENPNKIGDYINIEALKEAYNRAKGAKPKLYGRDLINVWHAISVHLWLSYMNSEQNNYE